MSEQSNFQDAIEDFRHQRNLAALQIIFGKISGKQVSLLSFDEISRKLRITGGTDRGLQEIPIKNIVGSVSRDSDFTRSFLPRQDNDLERWARVRNAVLNSPFGVPPVEVYKIGDAYFVKDGHHRVSVARSIHAEYIQAYVNEIQTRVPISSDISPEELIVKSEYADFLAKSHVDQILPDVDLQMTIPGSYKRLMDNIRVHRYFMGIDQKKEIKWEDAVVHWFNSVYLPVQQAISESGIVRDYPGKTEADLFLWISDHRYYLEKELGWNIRPDLAAVDLAKQTSPRISRVIERFIGKVINFFSSAAWEPLRQPGEWRKETGHKEDYLFRDILVPINGEEDGWNALEQSFIFLKSEKTSIHGLFVVNDKDSLVSEKVDEIRAGFNARCQRVEAASSLTVTEGEISRQVIDTARYSDLVVINVAHPPSSQIMDRIGSGLRLIIGQCSRPILAVQGNARNINRLLLAYDGSPRAKEALSVAAYLTIRWNIPLMVVSVGENERESTKLITQARQYLAGKKVPAVYRSIQGQAGEKIAEIALSEKADLIVMGGYGSPVTELMVGSTVDQVLRSVDIPVLICQ